MRFFIDQQVDSAVDGTLRRMGHEVWNTTEAGLGTAADDDLTVYADVQGAVVVTHDREFSMRRQRNTVGKHIWLACREFQAAEVIEFNLPKVIGALRHRDDIFIKMSFNAEPKLIHNWE